MLISKILSIASLAAAASATVLTVSYDRGYDDPNRTLTTVACSDGPNGLIKNGWQTQGQIPRFPHIGGWSDIRWNSPNCGKCLSATYQGTTVYFLAIDSVASGVNLAFNAMQELTNGQADFLGRIDADINVVDASFCSL